MTVRVFLADDHPIVRDGLSSMLARHEEFQLIGETGVWKCCRWSGA